MKVKHASKDANEGSSVTAALIGSLLPTHVTLPVHCPQGITRMQALVETRRKAPLPLQITKVESPAYHPIVVGMPASTHIRMQPVVMAQTSPAFFEMQPVITNAPVRRYRVQVTKTPAAADVPQTRTTLDTADIPCDDDTNALESKQGISVNLDASGKIVEDSDQTIDLGGDVPAQDELCELVEQPQLPESALAEASELAEKPQPCESALPEREVDDKALPQEKVDDLSVFPRDTWQEEEPEDWILDETVDETENQPQEYELEEQDLEELELPQLEDAWTQLGELDAGLDLVTEANSAMDLTEPDTEMRLCDIKGL